MCNAPARNVTLQQICDTRCRARKLSLNTLKTVLLLFSLRNLDLFTQSMIIPFQPINDHLIHPSREASFLGFILEPHLEWTLHIASKCLAAKRPILFCLKVYELYMGFRQDQTTAVVYYYDG